jgi:hypothetical protein
MKNQIIAYSLIAFSFIGYAQDETETVTLKTIEKKDLVSNKGVQIRPEAREIGIGFNAIPLFNYVGNIFNGNIGNTILNNSYFVNSDNMVYGKYFMKENLAIRVRFRFRDISTKYKNLVVQDLQTDPMVKVEDTYIRFDQLFGVSLGLEKRRGQGRIQGIYGAEISYNTGVIKEKYSYGNEMAGQNIAPNTTNNFFSGTSTNLSSRTLENNYGRSHVVGLNGFIGVEYFFAPKMAIAGEYTYGVGYSVIGETSSTTENYTNQTEIITDSNNGTRSFSLDTGNHGGAISLLMYF